MLNKNGAFQVISHMTMTVMQYPASLLSCFPGTVCYNSHTCMQTQWLGWWCPGVVTMSETCAVTTGPRHQHPHSSGTVRESWATQPVARKSDAPGRLSRLSRDWVLPSGVQPGSVYPSARRADWRIITCSFTALYTPQNTWVRQKLGARET